MTDRLWTGGETIGLPNNNDGGAAGITTAITVQLQSAGSITGVQYRAPDTATGTWIIALWEVTAADSPTPAGTLIESRTVAVTPGVFQDLMFAAPHPITPLTKVYRVGVWNSQGRYVATLGVFSATDITSPGGFIKAWHNGDDTVGLGSIRNGSFQDNAALTYPALGGGTWYGMGPIFEPAGSDLNIADQPGGASAGSTAETVAVDRVVTPAPGGATGGASAQTITNPFDVNVADGPGGVVAGASPSTVTTSAAQADTAVMPLLIQIMGCLQAEALKVNSPPANFHIRQGATFSPMADDSRDECCDGIAWVRPGPMYPSQDFPQQTTSPEGVPTNQWALQVELGIERCIPIVSNVEGNDANPTAAQWQAATQNAMDDRAALRRAICCIRALPGVGNRKVVVGQITPLENGGICGGEIVTLTIAVQACDC